MGSFHTARAPGTQDGWGHRGCSRSLRELSASELDEGYELVAEPSSPNLIAHALRFGTSDRFRRRSDDPTRNNGLGPGLFIVHQIVHAHHGRADVQGAGTDDTEFRVGIPRRAERT